MKISCNYLRQKYEFHTAIFVDTDNFNLSADKCPGTSKKLANQCFNVYLQIRLYYLK